MVRFTGARILFQSTPPCGGRHRCRRNRFDSVAVSIHAPLRGATLGPSFYHLFNELVSIHAPLRGATWSVCLRPSHTPSFNPRPPAGGDQCYQSHSPPDRSFNPRPPAGGDYQAVRAYKKPNGFNPRPPAGGDDAILGRVRFRSGFNPRPPAGGDVSNHGADAHRHVSIHAPCGGRLCESECGFNYSPGFNPRPPAGGDQRFGGAMLAQNKFQSTPPCGGRPCVSESGTRSLTRFQSTPPCGGRHQREYCWQQRWWVSIHAPLRGATWRKRRRQDAHKFQSTPPCGGRHGVGSNGSSSP